MRSGGPDELERRYSGWLLARNRRGTRFALWTALGLYPGFGVLDYLVAPHRWLWVLYGTRAVVVAATLAMFRLVAGRPFERHPNALSASYSILISFGISLMTVFMGGLSSPYYAGLSLIIVAIGLLFVWPARVVFVTHGSILASFVVPNVLLMREGSIGAVSNLFFLVSTAIIISTGQILAYSTHREQVATQLVIEQTKANLEQAHERLKQLDHFKSKFFANITHELKTPLTMLLTPLELMLDGGAADLAETQRATLEGMYKSGIKLLKLIDDLLDLSKLEESRLRLRVEEHDLVGYIRGLLAQVQPLAQRKGIALHFESNTESCVLWCDLERIERVFINLLSNATKFTPAGGNVWVALRDAGDRLRVEIRDDGPGFPADMSERVFERFFQVDMADARRHGGTGIGLALAKELVELHGGRIHARSNVGEGATFTVELSKARDSLPASAIDRRGQPRDLPDGKREADHGIAAWTTQLAGREEFRLLEIDEATEQRVIERDSDHPDHAHTILVVEDTPDVVRVIHMALRNHYRILAAPGGEKGMELAMREAPSLVITDLMMPEVDGLELTRRLRAEAKTRHVPIVMLTARADLEDRLAGLETGVNAYLAKPFSPRELLSTVRALLGTREATADILLTERLDSLEVVAGALAHEINNPLNYVKGSLDVVATHVDELLSRVDRRALSTAAAEELDALAARTRKLFDVAESGVRRIAATVALMRRYSREGYTRAPQAYDAFAAARDVMSLVVPATGRDVQIDASFEGDGHIECVPEEFNQVVSNLVQNAVEAVPEGAGRVQVRGFCEDGFVSLAVADNGPGIRPEDQAKIFTPFFSTKAPGRGMGMGLTIARRVVAGLGGTLRLKSAPGAGAEFLVRIPRLSARRARPPAVAHRDEATGAPPGARAHAHRAEARSSPEGGA
ncbi:MAG TPA: ATP-binding protein [Polyangiaceae bacterium]|nr:ATP-binding protein [Polyangiaceae bacterium]